MQLLSSYRGSPHKTVKWETENTVLCEIVLCETVLELLPKTVLCETLLCTMRGIEMVVLFYPDISNFTF